MKAICSWVAAASLALTASTAGALTLTAQGTALGFGLSTFATGFPAGSYGPLGIAVNGLGQVIVNSSRDRRNYVFQDVDNQVLSGALSSVSSGRVVEALTNVNGTVWAGGGSLARLNDDGSIAATFSNINISLGMWTNPVNDHIIAVGSASGVGGGLLDIDVSGAAPTARRINGSGSDGVTVSPDGTTVYTTNASYDIATGALVSNYSVSGADGMGIITSTNSLNGKVIVNTVFGNVVMLDPSTLAQTLIATSGSRGDFVGPDFTNGTLLLSQQSSIVRLSCGSGCAIGSNNSGGNSVPEPATLALIGIGLAGIGFRRRKSKAE